jgi:hypothetical protein
MVIIENLVSWHCHVSCLFFQKTNRIYKCTFYIEYAVWYCQVWKKSSNNVLLPKPLSVLTVSDCVRRKTNKTCWCICWSFIEILSSSIHLIISPKIVCVVYYIWRSCSLRNNSVYQVYCYSPRWNGDFGMALARCLVSPVVWTNIVELVCQIYLKFTVDRYEFSGGSIIIY